MKFAMFDSHIFEKKIFEEMNSEYSHPIDYFDVRLTEKTAPLAQGYACVCVFANDKLNSEVLTILNQGGTKLLALRTAGFNHVDLRTAKELGIKVVRVPEYSPYSVAEYAAGLILSLNRKIHKAYNRVREGNFSLEGLIGFDLHGKTVGVVGTGRIGKAFIRIMRGFGCQVLAYDLSPDQAFAEEVGCFYTSFKNLIIQSDIISLHVPLSSDNIHMMNEGVFNEMKRGSFLINTGRGALVDTKALVHALKHGLLGGAGLDVYEEEENYFFQDHSEQIMEDEVLARLMTFPNVILTGHQGFLTKEALRNIASTTLKNISDFENGQALVNEVNLIK